MPYQNDSTTRTPGTGAASRGATTHRRAVRATATGASCALAAALLLPALAWSAPQEEAEAPHDTGALQEIVVTATKTAQDLNKVPISISAYTQESMDQRGIRNIGDIVTQTPGLDLHDQGSNGVGERISIRGIDSNSGAATTGVYIDDTPIQARNNPVNLGGTVFPEVFDLERVEVLRGPQGTLFGAGAEGGVVRFITPQPSLTKYSSYARSEVADTQDGTPSYEAGAAFGGPIVNDKLGFRVSGWFRHDGGFVDRTSWETNQTLHHVNWGESGTARLAMLWKPTDSVRVTPSLLYQGLHENDSPNYWNVQTPEVFPVAPGTFTPPGSTHFSSGFAVRQQSTDKLMLPSLKIEVDVGNITLTSISSFFHRDETNVSDVTNFDIASALGLDYIFPTVSSGEPVTDLFIGATRQNVFTQELRMQSTDQTQKVRWVAGLFLQNSRLNDTQLAPTPLLPTLFAEAGQDFNSYFYDDTCVGHCSGLLNGNLEYYGNEHSKDLQYAAFGNVDWSMTDRLILNVGLRVARTKMTFRADEDGPVNNGTTSSGGDQSSSPVTPKVGLSFQMDRNNLLYASIAKGYRIGGANSHIPLGACGDDLIALGLTGAPIQYQPDSTLSYEIGSKNRLMEGRLSIDASVFLIDWKDIQNYFLLNCGYGFTQNQGKARSTGFDIDLNAKVGSNVILGLAVGYTHANFQQEIDTQGTNDRTGLPTVFVGANQTLGQTPWTITGSIDYNFHAFGGREGYVRLQDRFQSRNNGPYLFQNVNASVYDPQLQSNPSINQLDLRLGTAWSSFDVSLFINNLLDVRPQIAAQHYVQTPGGTENASPLFWIAALRPRTIGVTGTYRY